MKDIKKELETSRAINIMMLQKIDKLSKELELEKHINECLLDDYTNAMNTIEAKDADIMVMELILGVDSFKAKKPF